MMKFNKLMTGISIALCSSVVVSAHAQDIGIESWLAITDKARHSPQKLNSKASKATQYRLDISQIENNLTGSENLRVALPLPDGRFTTFILTPSHTMSEGLAQKYPNIKTFHGIDTLNPQNSGSFDVTPQGFHGVFKYNGETVYVEPKFQGNRSHYHSYYRKDAKPLSKAALGKRHAPRKFLSSLEHKQHRSSEQNKISDNQLRTLRLAVATTGEYGAYHGGTKESVMAALVTMVNRVNEIYKQDMGLQFQLVAKADAVIYTDPATDPFENVDDDIDKVQQVVDDAIGADNYDIGHIVTTGGGGLAGFEVVCTGYKAEGLTGSPEPVGDPFFIDYVAHELGHQLGADHTFNGTAGACDGNRADTSAYEPGSASTIMGYAGICDEQDLQMNSDALFHVHSLDQMVGTLNRVESCGTVVTTDNNAPTVDAGADYTIPARTPFMLSGSAIDPNGDSLVYSWEQHDLGGSTSSAAQDKEDDGKRPLFRVFLPTTSPTRTLPKLSSLLANQPSDGEALPTKTRELNFRLIARDSKGNSAYDGMKINVVENDEGFSVTEPGNWNSNSAVINWNTANTENAPVSCANVDILLSTDSGVTFSQELAKSTANDGSFEATLSGIETATARLKIVCSDNIFFAINKQDFSISAPAGPIKPVFSGHKPLQVNEDESITIAASDLTFNTSSVDTVTLKPGEHYSVDGLKVTPAANYNGTIEVNATAKNDTLESDTFKITITVTAQNDAPTVAGETLNLTQGAPEQTIDVLSNDSDVDGDTLSVASFNYTGSGTVKIQDNKLVYKPASDFSGSEKIAYTVSDGNEGTANGEVAITVAKKATPTPTKTSSGGGSLWALLLMVTATLPRRFRR